MIRSGDYNLWNIFREYKAYHYDLDRFIKGLYINIYIHL